MFKPNHYYHVIHKDFGLENPVECIIKTIKKKYPSSPSDDLWDVEIIKLIHTVCTFRTRLSSYKEGTIKVWYEKWCSSIREFDHKPNECEILAIVL